MVDRSVFWKVALITGIILSLLAFIFGWIGFGVPDWQALQRFNSSPVEFYGLWSYCEELGAPSGTVCRHWPSAETQLFNGSRPGFVRAAEGLITTGMILLSLGLAVAAFAIVLPLLIYISIVLGSIAFIVLVIGLPIFGRQSNNLSASRGDVSYNKRYGFWFIVPTIVLEFLAILAFMAAATLYRLFGFGNLATGLSDRAATGRQVLGPPNRLNFPPNNNFPYGLRAPPIYPAGGILPVPAASPAFIGGTIPSLLSEYLRQRRSQSPTPIVIQSVGPSVLPQPSIIRATTPTPAPSVAPAYVRSNVPAPRPGAPIINLSGKTILGPMQQIS